MLLAPALLALGFRDLDPTALQAALRSAGHLLPLIPVPWILAMLLDTFGWRCLLRGVGVRAPARELAALRVAGDALVLAAPGGAVLSEALKPMVLARRHDAPGAAVVASLAARKWLTLLVHGLQAVAGVVLGWHVFRAASGHLERPGWVEGAALGMMALLLGVALVLPALARKMVRRRAGAAGADPCQTEPPSGEHRGRRMRAALEALDVELRRLEVLSTSERLQALAGYLGVGCLEVVEVWLLARIVGLEIGLGEAAAIESAVVFLRSVAFFTPGGLGVQDVGYATFFVALSGPSMLAAGAAFALLKRGRELLVLLVGLATLPWLRRRPGASMPNAAVRIRAGAA